jgi:hypothetical protein
MSNLSFHGCFSTVTGDTLEAYHIHSNEWTQVRSKKHNGVNKKTISKSLGSWKVIQNAKGLNKHGRVKSYFIIK